MAEGEYFDKTHSEKITFLSFLIFRQIISFTHIRLLPGHIQVSSNSTSELLIFLLSKCTDIFYVQHSSLFPERINSGKMHQKYIQKNTTKRPSIPKISQPVVLSSSLALDVQTHGVLCKEDQISTEKITLYLLF